MRGFPAQVDFWRVNSGQPRQNSLRIRNIIKPDDVDIVWYSMPQRLQGVDQLDR